MAEGRENEGRASQELATNPDQQPARAASTLTVNTLGRLAIRWNGQPLEGSNLRKTEALLIYLALNPGQQGRSRLAGLLWGDLPEDRARANLRHALWDLRRKLNATAFESDRRSMGLSPDVLRQVDALDFEAELKRAERCRQEGERAAMIDHLEAGIALYGGDFLARFDLPGCFEFEEWAVRRRVWLRESALEALRRLVTHYTRQGAYGKALRYARRQLSLDPWREEAHRELMRLLALTGRRSAALAQYKACRRLLETELGLEPLEETTALYERIRDSYIRTFVDAELAVTDLRIYESTSLPFVGRGDEHAQLVAWWERARQRKGWLTLVEGEAGVGKTRLVEEVARYAEAEGATVLRGKCYEFATAVPYQPIAEALRGALRDRKRGGQGDRETGRQGEKETGKQGNREKGMVFPLPPVSPSPHLPLTLSPVWLSELSRLLPELRQLHPDLPEPAHAPGEAARQRLFEAVARFLKQGVGYTSRPSPPASCILPPTSCFLFLDDLHWADPSTLDLLHYLVRQLADAPVWIVGTYRPEEVNLSHRLTRLRQGLARDRLVDHLVLRPLCAEAVEEIARSLVGEEEGTSFGDFLYRESEGNPFILTEMVSSLQEQGALGRTGDEEDHWRWSGPPTVEVLPAGVRDVILQRVGRLSQAAQRLLSLAAVVGWQFDAPLLHAAAERDAVAVDESLQEWLSRRLVQPRLTSNLHSPFPNLHSPPSNLQSPISVPQYDFSHDKIRAVIYAEIEVTRRRTLHRRVAEALEQRLGERIEGQVGLLAHHWEQAAEPGKAVEYHLRAGDQARLVYAHQEAIDHYRRALAALKDQGEHERAARTLMKLGLTYHNAFDFRQARRAYDEGFALWQRAGVAQSATTSAPASGLRPQTLRVRWVEPTTLDPAMVSDSDTGSLVTHLFSGLVALSPELDVVPDVARAWEVSEGGRRFVFQLRDDVVWSDGRSVTARDFEYAWKRALHPAIGSQAASLYDLKGARAFHRGDGKREDVGVCARDESTLIVDLEEPVGYFLQLLTKVSYSPVPRHVIEDHGEGWTEESTFVANGPFRLESWQRGESLMLKRNPTYHGRFRGNLERVGLLPLSDWSDRLARYESDDLDVLGITYFPTATREEARQRYAREYVSGPRLETSYVAFDTSRPPFDDARVRRAFAMATDREALADVVLQGYVSPATGGFVPPGMPGHASGIGLPYDPERARRLLAEVGYPDGRGFPAVGALVFDAAKARGDYLKSQWREVLGVEIRWDALPWAEFLDRLGKAPPEILVLMWVADYPDPDNFLRVCRARTWAGWRNETYDRLVRKARRITDQGERMRLYRRADRTLVAAAPILPLTYERGHLLVKPWVSRYPTSAMQAAFWKDVVIKPRDYSGRLG